MSRHHPVASGEHRSLGHASYSPTNSRRETCQTCITKDLIFKSVMFALAVIYTELISQSVWAAERSDKSTGSQYVPSAGSAGSQIK